jgi:hypothetical protein
MDATYCMVETDVNRLPELHQLSVDGFCAETKTIYLMAVIGMVMRVNHSATSQQ